MSEEGEVLCQKPWGHMTGIKISHINNCVFNILMCQVSSVFAENTHSCVNIELVLEIMQQYPKLEFFRMTC